MFSCFGSKSGVQKLEHPPSQVTAADAHQDCPTHDGKPFKTIEQPQPSSTNYAGVPVLHLEGAVCSVVAVATVSTSSDAICCAQQTVPVPRVLCRLLSIAGFGSSFVPSFASNEGYLDLPARGRAGRPSLRAAPFFVNDAARIAWAASDVGEIAQALKELARNDPTFLEILAEVASSFTSHSGGSAAAETAQSSSSPYICITYVPKSHASSDVPGGVGLHAAACKQISRFIHTLYRWCKYPSVQLLRAESRGRDPFTCPCVGA